MGVGGGCRSSPPGESEEVHWSPGPAAYGEPVGVGVRLARALAPELMPTALTGDQPHFSELQFLHLRSGPAQPLYLTGLV